MIDYFKVYQSIDNTILKNVSEVFKPNGNLVLIYYLLFAISLVLFIFIGIFFVLIPASPRYFDKSETKEIKFYSILVIILLILSLVFNALYSAEENKNKEYSKNIEINNSIKNQKELFSNIMGNKDPKEFLEQGKKLEKFCNFYYSPTDNNFCKDNKINKYTFNLVFSKIYGNNEDKTTDLEKALKYIKKENSND